MDINAKKIIAEIEEKFPPEQPLVLKNISDLNLEAKFSYAYQHIIGVTRADMLGGYVSIESYKRKMTDLIEKASLKCHCIGWPFRGYEMEEARKVLEELSDYYNADLPLDKIFRELNIKKDSDDYYYIVITVVIIPNSYIE